MQNYERFDTCLGSVEYKSSYGVYLILENGERAFAHGFTTLPTGSKVWCSIRKLATETKDILVKVDSVLLETAA